MADDVPRTGFPNPAQDHAETSLNLHTLAVRHPEATFFLHAEGEGLRSAGIFPGDILVVDRAIDPVSGDIVIAIVADIFAIRCWTRDAAGAWLATDQETLTIGAEVPVQIWGVVTFVLHAPGQRRTR